MSLWLNDGKLVMNGDGDLVECDDCPCGPQPCPCVDNTPESWDLTLGTTSTGCPHCEIAGPLTFARIGPCSWLWQGDYPKVATIEWDEDLARWVILLNIGSDITQIPSTDTDCASPGGSIGPNTCSQWGKWVLTSAQFECCDTITLGAPSEDFSDCPAPCDWPVSLTLSPVGGC